MVRSRNTCCSGNETRQSVFPQYLINGTNFSEKTVEHKMWVSIFSTHYVWNIHHSKMNSAKYHKCTRLHVKYPLFLLVLEIRLQFSQQFSEKHSNSNLMENRPLGTRLFHAYGRRQWQGNRRCSQRCERAQETRCGTVPKHWCLRGQQFERQR